MIKKFKEYINEDYFSKLANRKDNDTKRKGNILSNARVLESIDMGGNVYWADIDFCYEDNHFFTIDEALSLQSEFEKYGWRLPLLTDYSSLLKSCSIDITIRDGVNAYNTLTLTSNDNNNELVFNAFFAYPEAPKEKELLGSYDYLHKTYMGFANDKPFQPGGGAGLYVNMVRGASYANSSNIVPTPNLTTKNGHACIRLVKDKIKE